MLQFPIVQPPGQADWQAAEHLTPALSAEQGDWLLDHGSLTAKLKAHCRHFSVQLLGQQTGPMLADEARWLGQQQPVTVREVLLHCDQQPWVFARSVFPQSSLLDPALQLQQLGNRPLGEHLFAQADLTRSSIELCQFPADSRVGQLHQQLGFAAQALWGRRSCFQTGGHRVLVAEVFIGAAPICLATPRGRS